MEDQAQVKFRLGRISKMFSLAASEFKSLFELIDKDPIDFNFSSKPGDFNVFPLVNQKDKKKLSEQKKDSENTALIDKVCQLVQRDSKGSNLKNNTENLTRPVTPYIQFYNETRKLLLQSTNRKLEFSEINKEINLRWSNVTTEDKNSQKLEYEKKTEIYEARLKLLERNKPKDISSTYGSPIPTKSYVLYHQEKTKNLEKLANDSYVNNLQSLASFQEESTLCDKKKAVVENHRISFIDDELNNLHGNSEELAKKLVKNDPIKRKNSNSNKNFQQICGENNESTSKKRGSTNHIEIPKKQKILQKLKTNDTDNYRKPNYDVFSGSFEESTSNPNNSFININGTSLLSEVSEIETINYCHKPKKESNKNV